MTNFRKPHREGKFATATILLILITMAFVPIMGSAQETSFVLVRIFQNPSPNLGDEFDHAVAIDGNKILIGAGLDDTIAEDAGIAYLFDVNTGQLIRTFQNPMPDAGDSNDSYQQSIIYFRVRLLGVPEIELTTLGR